MADKARNNVDHHIFFEAMRDLRLKRKNFERVFMEQLFVAFANLGQARCSGAHLVPLVSYEAAPGTSADDVEKAVALEAMLGRVRHRDGRPGHLWGKGGGRQRRTPAGGSLRAQLRDRAPRVRPGSRLDLGDASGGR